MADSLTLPQARKPVLLSQRLPPQQQKGRAIDATLQAIEHLGYVQIDTISVIQRAHHHTLWNRNPRYSTGHLDQLTREKRVFEYWTHAAAYLPMNDYRFSLPRKNALARGDQKHWYAKDVGLMKEVLHRIREEGPRMARDFDSGGKKTAEWRSKPAKRALECLFMQGDLMVSSRHNFHKVYDLTERVLPEGIDTSEPSSEEYTRYLITRYLQVNGLGQPAEIAYLLKNCRQCVEETLNEMELAGELQRIRVGSDNYYVFPASLHLLSKPLARSKLKILSPFDNLLIQRRRMQALFDFEYLIECYLPAAKRKYGYFSLPLLWDGRLVARMDCKADRKTSILHIQHLALEPQVKKTDRFLNALYKELKEFLQFQNCSGIQLHQTTPPSIKEELQMVIEND